MALLERNIPLAKSRSRSALENKKLMKFSTTTSLVKSIDIENENTPTIKEPVLLQPKRTLSKCKARIDLKSSKNLLSEHIVPKNESVPKVLSKSRTTAKLMPGSDLIPSNTELSTTPSFTIPKSSKPMLKSLTSVKLTPVHINIEEPSRPAPSLAKTRQSSRKSLSKCVTSVKLPTVVDIPIENKKVDPPRYVKPSRRSLSRLATSTKLQTHAVAIDIEGCETSKCVPKESSNEPHVPEEKTRISDEPVPEKSLKKQKSKIVNKPPTNTQQQPVTFRKTRSRSLLNALPEPFQAINIEIDEPKPVQDNVKPSLPPQGNSQPLSNNLNVLETPKTVGPTDRGKRLTFTDVDVFYFDRTSGHSSIPRDGFNTIGMGMKHSHHENLRFNLSKDIFVRRKLFNLEQQESLVEQSSPSVKRRHSQAKLEEEDVNAVVSLPTSPSKVNKNQPVAPKNSLAVRDISLDNSESGPGQDLPQPRIGTRRSTSNLLRQTFENGQNKKLSSAFSVVNFDLSTPSVKTEKQLNKSRSVFDMSQTFESPVPSVLTPKQRGSSSISPTSRPKGECGTRGMTPLSSKSRCSLLKNHGIFNIDREEAEQIKTIRESRQTCGCSCKGDCRPETCECALNDIGKY